jgi:hypothetical protein
VTDSSSEDLVKQQQLFQIQQQIQAHIAKLSKEPPQSQISKEPPTNSHNTDSPSKVNISQIPPPPPPPPLSSQRIHLHANISTSSSSSVPLLPPPPPSFPFLSETTSLNHSNSESEHPIPIAQPTFFASSSGQHTQLNSNNNQQHEITQPLNNQLLISPIFSLQPSPPIILDLMNVPVGQMANVIRSAVKLGHPKYTPIDASKLSSTPIVHVEPGRLEARISEFYRKLQQLTANEKREKDNDRDRDRDRDQQSDGLEGWERHVRPNSLDESKVDDSSRIVGRKHSRSIVAATAKPVMNGASTSSEVEISADNMGHKLLRGLGWQQGVGLGVDSGGRVEPVRGDKAGKIGSDRTGLGVNMSSNKYADSGLDFNAYRKQLSSDYHYRISEREQR